jgi:hypothetical protein
MAELMLGVLAEDDNDCEVIRVLIRRIFEARGVRSGAWRLQKRAGKGCSKLKRKTARWLVELAEAGCTAAIIIDDLDRNPLNGSLNDEAALARELAAIPVPHGLPRLVCIPVEEVEAWFFSSEQALERACGKPQKALASPHLVAKPKETLIRMSRGANKKPRYSENENHKLAEVLDLTECKKRCRAFAELYNFASELAPA